ncbi:MAG: MoaD/ThiS family protein [Acidobacteria bacterium]|nr:MoaD/ThiS family protein [Acidobacteriota bacterium]
MTVYIPGPLRSYTRDRASVEAGGASLADLLADMERQFPGIRFRMIDEQGGIREHIKLFVGFEQVKDLSVALSGATEVHVVCALSGGTQ